MTSVELTRIGLCLDIAGVIFIATDLLKTDIVEKVESEAEIFQKAYDKPDKFVLYLYSLIFRNVDLDNILASCTHRAARLLFFLFLPFALLSFMGFAFMSRIGLVNVKIAIDLGLWIKKRFMFRNLFPACGLVLLILGFIFQLGSTFA